MMGEEFVTTRNANYDWIGIERGMFVSELLGKTPRWKREINAISRT
jgi:hypothetical protein